MFHNGVSMGGKFFNMSAPLTELLPGRPGRSPKRQLEGEINFGVFGARTHVWTHTFVCSHVGIFARQKSSQKLRDARQEIIAFFASSSCLKYSFGKRLAELEWEWDFTAIPLLTIRAKI